MPKSTNPNSDRPPITPGSKVRLSGKVAIVVRVDPLGNLRLKLRDCGEFWCSPDVVEVLLVANIE
jgi:hypothetical protein